MRNVPILKYLVALVLTGSTAFSIAPAQQAEESGTADETRTVDGYAAMVNDRVVLESDVQAAAIPLLRNLARTLETRLRELQLTGENEPDLEAQRKITEEFNVRAEEERNRALEYLIERHLIVEEFERNEGKVPDRMIDDHIQRIIDDNFGGDRSLLVDKLRQEQLSFEEFRAQRRDDLVSTLLQQQELSDLPSVSPQEVYALYESRQDRYRQPAMVDLSGIALSQGETDEERKTKRGQADTLRQRLLEGEDFATLAKAHSEGRRAQRGGHWGWRVTEDNRPEMIEAIKSTPTGGITDVIEIETDEGGGWFYILHVGGRKEPAVTPFEQVRDDLRAELEGKAGDETYRAWIKRLKEHHFVQIF